MSENKSNSQQNTKKASNPEEALAKLAQENLKLKEALKQAVIAHEEALKGKQQAIVDLTRLREKLSEYEHEKMFLERAKRITNIANLMVLKGMIEENPKIVKQQIKDLAEMDDKSLENWKKLVINTVARIPESKKITASEDNSNKNITSNLNTTFFIEDSDETTMDRVSPSWAKKLEGLSWSLPFRSEDL